MDPDKSPSRDRTLSREEFDEVMRRAAELAASETTDSDRGISESEVYRIAGEVGLPEHHVRRALTEIRSGSSLPSGSGLLDRLYGVEVIRASRVVSGTPRELSRRLDEFLVGGQLLEPIRRTPRLLQYRPAVDWMSQVARAASSMSKRYYVASAKSVEIALEAVDQERTLVELAVDAGIRSDYVVGGVLGGGAGGVGGGVGLTVLLGSAVPMFLAVPAGVVVGAGVWAGVVWGTSRAHRKRLMEVMNEVEGILDKLELGEDLEPPPPSWRRWVKRHFHGAREMFTGMDYDEMTEEDERP